MKSEFNPAKVSHPQDLSVLRSEFKIGLETLEQVLLDEIRLTETNLRNEISLSEACINARIDTLEAKMMAEFSAMRWMIGTLIVVNIGLLGKVLTL